MLNYETKKCPKCRKKMIKIAGDGIGYVDNTLADKWRCRHCGYVEIKSFYEKLCEKYSNKK